MAHEAFLCLMLSSVVITVDCNSPGSADVAAALAGAIATAQQAAFNLKGVWDSLPFSLYLQACGSAASRDDVSALHPDADKTMGELPITSCQPPCMSMPQCGCTCCGSLP